MKHASIALALCLCLPAAARAAPPATGDTPAGVNGEIGQGMAEARAEIVAELAKARTELETQNLDVGNGLHFGRHRDGGGKHAALPGAEISPRGDFLVGGKAVAIDARQRARLLAYRGLVIDIARDGLDVGERSALAAVDVVDRGLFGLMVGALTGSTERRVERQMKAALKPAIERICARLPVVLASQQQLAADLPAFAPYADLRQDDIADCDRSVREELATR
ncbi:hypothetical protein [Xanthomonas massiliensis]|uniref:hypothetical protein n=1 Tax=Xanthomonas massiliensis TaxID=1720302 RepID=UPI0008254D8E|nr:hypothetical protein [Xanthomonas massiliensis]